MPPWSRLATVMFVTRAMTKAESKAGAEKSRSTRDGVLVARTDTRCARLRAMLLGLVWALPALWSLGHTLSHELVPAHHEVHSGTSIVDALATDCIDHGHHHHGLFHPDSTPLVSAERTKHVSSPLILTATPEVAPSHVAMQSRWDIAARCTLQLARGVSGPRAPPLS